MNNQRRNEIRAIEKRIEQLSPKLDALREEINSIRESLENVRDEEQSAFDAMPESMQDGERGERMQSSIDALEVAISDLEDLHGNLPLSDDIDVIIGSTDEAKGED